MQTDDDCDLNESDRVALRLVPAPEPPPDFGARLMSRIARNDEHVHEHDRDRRSRRGLGGLAAAAIVMLMLGGVVSAKLFSNATAQPGPAAPHPAALVTRDAGPEVRGLVDGREI